MSVSLKSDHPDWVDQGEGEDVVEKSISLRLKYFVTSLDISGADVPTDVSQWHLKNLIRLWLCKILAADLQYYHLSLTVLIQFVNSSVYLWICENLQIWILRKVWQQYNYIHRETNVIKFFCCKISLFFLWKLYLFIVNQSIISSPKWNFA